MNLKLIMAAGGIAILIGAYVAGHKAGSDAVESRWNADIAERALAHAEALKASQGRTAEANTRTLEAEQALQDKEQEHEAITAELLARNDTRVIREVVRIPVEGECSAVPTFDWDLGGRLLNDAIRAHSGGAAPETTAGGSNGDPWAPKTSSGGPTITMGSIT